MNIVLIGEEAAGLHTLRALAGSNHRIVAVMASPAKGAMPRSTVWSVAHKMGYPTWPAYLVKDPTFAETIRSEEVDILLSVHSLFVIESRVLEAPGIGCFNLHPGPLPRYAGLNPISWALYRGEKRHGITLHRMTPQIDAGPIAYQESLAVGETDTALSLTSKCVKAGVPLVLQLLETASTDPGAIPLVEQDLGQREYFGAAVPQSGRLSWLRPARDVVNLVRAFDFFPYASPWGHPRTSAGNLEIGIVKAVGTGQSSADAPGTVGHCVESGVHVACADEWIVVTQVMVNGRCVAARDVLKPGDRFDTEC